MKCEHDAQRYVSLYGTNFRNNVTAQNILTHYSVQQHTLNYTIIL